VTPRETLERYFQALRDHDWQTLRSCVAPDVHRTGPYGDVVEGRDSYAEFLAGIVPTLENYELRVHDIAWSADGGAWVRLSEILGPKGARTEHPEALFFEFAADGRISRVDIYVKRLARDRS